VRGLQESPQGGLQFGTDIAQSRIKTIISHFLGGGVTTPTTPPGCATPVLVVKFFFRRVFLKKLFW